MNMRAVIMAGGKGTRVAGMYPDLPKPMIPLLGRPLLEHQIRTLVSQGFFDITIIVGHMMDRITEYFGEGTGFGAKISYIKEETPLGTGGALALLPREDCLVVFGDIFFKADMGRFVGFHNKRGAAVTLFSHPNSHPADSDVIICGNDGAVTGWAFKNIPRENNLRNLVNAGIYVISAGALPCGEAVKKDLDKDIIYPLIAEGGVYAYRSTEYVKDMGTPARLESVIGDMLGGVCEARVLSRPQRAVFFDRDGVLNRRAGLISAPDGIELLPGAGEAVAGVNKSHYLAVCLTNQPVIARGMTGLEGLDRIHGRLDNLLAEHGAYLDDLFFCPHHPDKGYPEEDARYKMDCECRKPKPGMFYIAAERYNINLSQSWMIGDTTTDIEAALAAGCRAVGVRTGDALLDGKCRAKPEFIADSVYGAVEYILQFS